ELFLASGSLATAIMLILGAQLLTTPVAAFNSSAKQISSSSPSVLPSVVFILTSPNHQNDGQFGSSVAVGGGITVVGAQVESSSHIFEGRVYTFDSATGAPITTLTDPHPKYYGEFGCAVAISGGIIAVGAHGSVNGGRDPGHAYTFNA